jgi:glyoxalase family protein
METGLLGIHHVTAIAGDPQRNIDFYTDVLGLRLVKLTVNFDDPGSYHLYYGDALGHPGTILTFFAWPGARRGHQGIGQIAITSLSIPQDALDYWSERLRQRGVTFEGPTAHFDERVLALHDPDGLALELVAHPAAADRSGWEAWETSPVPADYAVRGLHAVTLWESDRALTATLLMQTLGLRPAGDDGSVARYAAGAAGPGALVDVRHAPTVQRGAIAVGTVHHVAWRTPSDEEQLVWREHIGALGAHVTPVMDRQYFHSIYFHEPGGVLFEIATDPPGFATDETPAHLGTHLKLPPWLEPHRAQVEQTLPPVRLPGAALETAS